MRIRKMKSVDVQLHDSTKVKLKTAGNTSVVQFTAGVNKSCPVQNLSKDTYLDKKTGEVKQKKKTENRYQSPQNVRKSINGLMDLIRCNATDSAKCKWITLTYASVMTDGKQAFLDAKLFLRRLKRHLAKQANCTLGQKSFQYITIAEPQGESHSNTWHHIVEQSQIGKRANFDANQVHNVNNIIAIPSGADSIHSKISAHYSSKFDFTDGLTVRDWLATKSFDEQFEYGKEFLEEFGEVIATDNGWIFKPY